MDEGRKRSPWQRPAVGGSAAALPRAEVAQAARAAEGPYPTRLSERGSPVFKSSFTTKNHSSRPN